ncbi:hypothetical protein JTM01_40325, partial [Pseudomonas aeruginosa]|nr:hypothetical protein [Pseudomonas aeruginosa]
LQRLADGQNGNIRYRSKTLFTRGFGRNRTRFTLFSAFFTTRLLRTRFTLAANAFILLACGRSGFAFFRLLGCALRLNASFRFFQLLTRMGNVLLFQF